MTSSPKIITKLHERRQIEADLRRMLSASSELEFRRWAQQIASQGPPVIPVIAGNLDRADGPMLAAMGMVAAYLDRPEMVRALTTVLRQQQRSEHSRMGALTILERFLGEPVDDELRPGVESATVAAVSALDGVLEQADKNPIAVIDYVQGLDHQEPDVVLAVIRALCQEPADRAAGLLRMMAQDVREEIAEEALEALGSFRSQAAALALQALLPTAAPALRPLAERLLRKLHFAGIEAERPARAGAEWRALISPVDGRGQHSIWFIQGSPAPADARLMSISLSDRAGAAEAAGREHVSYMLLPPKRPLGYVHDIALPGGPGVLLMVEAHLDVGRRMVVEALARNRQTQIPVAGYLRWAGPWLWAYEADALPARVLPRPTAEDAALVAASDRLLSHPALATWTAHGEFTRQAAEEALRRPEWDLRLWVRRLAGELFAEPAVALVLHQRLLALSEWLLLAGEEMWSRMALAAGMAVREQDGAQIPFVQALVRRDLELTLDSLKQTSEPDAGSTRA